MLGAVVRMTEPFEFVLISRLRELIVDETATERQLRQAGEQAEGWERVLQGQIVAGEQRLRRLNADPASPLAEIAAELRHVDAVRSELVELRSLVEDLDQRARELRTAWLLGQAQSSDN
jgi:small-conductance mechanosensitive channel